MYIGLCESETFVKIKKEAEATLGRPQDRNKEEFLKQSKEGEFSRAEKPDPVTAVRPETSPGTCGRFERGTGRVQGCGRKTRSNTYSLFKRQGHPTDIWVVGRYY